MSIILNGTTGITTPDLTSTDDITANSATVLTSASSIPAANLTGSLPAIDGSALTGVGGVASLNGQTGAITNTDYNVIGSWVGSAKRVNQAVNTTAAGSTLTYAYWSGSSWTYPSLGLSGTWRFVGGVRHASANSDASLSTIWVRVS
jgi:hypothetical protein